MKLTKTKNAIHPLPKGRSLFVGQDKIIIIVSLLTLVLYVLANIKCAEIPTIKEVRDECVQICTDIMIYESDKFINEVIKKIESKCISKEEMEALINLLINSIYYNNSSYQKACLNYYNVMKSTTPP